MPDMLSTDLTPSRDRVTAKATPAQITAWQGRITHALDRQKTWHPWWDANLRRYAPQAGDNPVTYASDVNTNRDFTLVERKKADLFFRRPEVQVLPSPRMIGQEAILQSHEAILNELLAEDGVDVGDLMDTLLFDALCPAGMFWTVMGYQGTFQAVTLPAQTDPMTGMELQPATEADVPIYEDIFWTRLSPKQILIPEEWKSTAYDRAPWLGYRFSLPLRVARRRWTLPAGFAGDSAVTSLTFDHGDPVQTNEPVVVGTEVWYRSSVYRDHPSHPLHQTKLVLIDGIDAPVEHLDSPHQSFDELGRLTPDSLIGFPIHGGTLRVLSDSAYIPSDCTISTPLVNELNKFRDQMVRSREANIPLRVFNEEILPPEALRKILAAPIGGMIPVPGEAFAGEGPFKEIARANYPRENFTSNDYIDNDIARTHAIDATQAGAQDAGTVKTATEIQMQQGNANARLDKERARVVAFYIKGVEKFSTLVQRYLRADKAAEIVGDAAAQAWAQWARTLSTRLSLTIQPDSSLRTDTAQRRNESMQLYQFLANDPAVNRQELTTQVLRDFHKDPTRMVKPPPPPPPEKPSVSFSIKGEDLNPMMPQYQNVVKILADSGVVLQAPPSSGGSPGVSPPSGNGDQPHPGAVAPVEPLNKHAADLTGNLQGSGQPVPFGPGGGRGM